MDFDEAFNKDWSKVELTKENPCNYCDIDEIKRYALDNRYHDMVDLLCGHCKNCVKITQHNFNCRKKVEWFEKLFKDGKIEIK